MHNKKINIISGKLSLKQAMMTRRQMRRTPGPAGKLEVLAMQLPHSLNVITKKRYYVFILTREKKYLSLQILQDKLQDVNR